MGHDSRETVRRIAGASSSKGGSEHFVTSPNTPIHCTWITQEITIF